MTKFKSRKMTRARTRNRHMIAMVTLLIDTLLKMENPTSELIHSPEKKNIGVEIKNVSIGGAMRPRTMPPGLKSCEQNDRKSRTEKEMKNRKRRKKRHPFFKFLVHTLSKPLEKASLALFYGVLSRCKSIFITPQTV